jgi:beta-N-acetylhexosaminidase
MKKILLLALFALSFFFGRIISLELLSGLIKNPDTLLEIKSENINKNIDDYFGDSLFLKLETFRIVENLTDSQKAGMLLMPAFESNNTYSDLLSWVDSYDIGGFMVLRGDISKMQIDQIQDIYIRKTKLPLFVSLDAEPSLIKNRVSDLDGILDTSSIKTELQSIDQANKISDYLIRNGFNLNFAPVYDNDQNKTVIGNRSYGQNIDILAGLFSEASKDKDILTTAKHFPGHGSVVGDTHLSLQTIKGDLLEIENFKSAILNKVPFMMVGHLAVESDNDDFDTGGEPSTISKKIIENILIKDLDFKGIVITDAMNMSALDEFDNLNIRALEAGADILLMPRDLSQAHNEILIKMSESEEFKSLVEQKVRKIVRMKIVMNWLK